MIYLCTHAVGDEERFLTFCKGTEEGGVDMHGLQYDVGLIRGAAHLKFPQVMDELPITRVIYSSDDILLVFPACSTVVGPWARLSR